MSNDRGLPHDPQQAWIDLGAVGDEYFARQRLPRPNNQTNNTFGGIYSPEGGPTGGYAVGNPTFTGHTGSYLANGVSKGHGGGDRIYNNIEPQELLHARPDLRKDAPAGVFDTWQHDSTPDTSKVTQVTRDPRSEALRGLSREQSGAISRQGQAAQNRATRTAGEA